MNEILIKILATALTLSQVTTAPDAVKTRFDPVQDRSQVVDLLRAGCAHVRKAFDIESINLDDLIATAMDDPQALKSDVPVFRGINFRDLHTAYRQFCRNETIPDSPIDIARVITFYNDYAAKLWGRAPRIGPETDDRFCGSFRLWWPDERPLPHHETPMALALRDGRAVRNQAVIIERPDGSRVTVLVNIDPICDDNGHLVGAINTFLDTTASTKVEAK